jgi:hypothetical protein
MYCAALVFVLLVFATGCAVRQPDTFRLVRQNGAAVLVPPGVAGPEVARRTLASGIAPGPARCRPADGIAVERRGRTLRLTVARDALVHQPAGWLTRWASEAEAAGCIAPGSASELALRVAEALPLDPGLAARLLNVNDVRAGYVDLAAGNRLQVDSPIFRDGTAAGAPAVESAVTTGGTDASIQVEAKVSPALAGYERAWYAVRSAGAAGLTIQPLSAERHIEGQTESRPAPATNHLALDRAQPYLRLLYRSDRTIVIFGAPTRAELDRLSNEMAAGTAACQGRSCAAIPANVGVNPEIVVTVNGQERALPVGSTVTSAIRAGGGRPEEVIARLAIQRPYGTRLATLIFDRAVPDVLGLRLQGGEVLHW